MITKEQMKAIIDMMNEEARGFDSYEEEKGYYKALNTLKNAISLLQYKEK